MSTDQTAAEPNWPRKTRELHNHHMDSTVWDRFAFRKGDIVIATYGKSGTTWMQQIVSQLLFGGQEGLDLHALSPWLDMRILPSADILAALEAQTHRRFVKTHLPVDALVFSPDASYIYVARDGRDVLWSMYNHHANFRPEMYRLLNDTPGRVGPPLDPPPASIRDYFHAWLDGDGHPFWSFWDNVRSWWEIRHLPNVRLVHFAQMKADLAGDIRRIAAFLDIPIDETRWPAILEHCGFDYMRAHGDRIAPSGGAAWQGGAETFLHKGTNGRWRDVLTPEDIAKYERIAREQLGEDCAHWLASGNLAEDAPRAA